MNEKMVREGLRDIRRRSATIDAAIDAGAVDAVIPLLQDRNEGVRWSAIRILGELRDDRAITPLIALLDQGKNVSDAHRALCEITGQDCGETSKAWRLWVAQNSELPAADEHKLCPLTDAELVARAAAELPIETTGEGHSYALSVSLPEGRSQQVWVDFSQKDPDGNTLVQLCTPCGKIDPARYESVLKLNMSLPYGAIAIAEVDSTLCFVVVDTYLRVTAHPEDIANSVMSLAHHGDSIEALISDEDRW